MDNTKENVLCLSINYFEVILNSTRTVKIAFSNAILTVLSFKTKINKIVNKAIFPLNLNDEVTSETTPKYITHRLKTHNEKIAFFLLQ